MSEVETKGDFEAFAAEMRIEFAAFDQRMTIRMAGMLVVLAGVLALAARFA